VLAIPTNAASTSWGEQNRAEAAGVSLCCLKVVGPGTTDRLMTLVAAEVELARQGFFVVPRRYGGFYQ